MDNPAAVSKPSEKKRRLLDRCRHFVGEIVDGKVRIYCSRCGQFLVLTAEELKQHMASDEGGNIMRKILGLILCFTLTGCATMRQPYQAGGLPTLDAAAPTNSIEQDGVTVAVRVLSAEEAKGGLVRFLPSHGIQPILVSVRNGSLRTYCFQKGSISPSSLPVLEVYRKVRGRPDLTARGLSVYAPHPWGTSEEEIGWNLMFTLAMPLLLPSLILGDISEVSWNSAFKNDLLKKEFKDGPIRSGQTRSGLVFLSREKLPKPIRIELVEESGSESLVFRFEKQVEFHPRTCGGQLCEEITF